MPARNLVVCIDGTSNKFGRRNTNVVKLYRQIDLDAEAGSDAPQQRAYYSSGIGTHAKNLPLLHRVEKVISDGFDMALAWNVEENVKDAYGWLARNYQQGDRIYLFGFSRGAYQVRVLAGLVHEVGLIRTPTEKQIEMAFGHYRCIHPHKPETREMATEFKKTYCWQGVRIHFVGVWDTVSSVGLIKGDVFLSTSASVTNASHFRHALALDERRVKFMPEYFWEMNAHRNNMLRPNVDGDIKEVWFSGCHADVGGVSRLGQPYHAGNVSLSWMQDEASEHGLRLKPVNLTCTPDDVRSGRSNSLKLGWMLLEIMFPFRHQVSFSGAGNNKLKWHWFRPRRIIPGQRIHFSVWCGDAYRPHATLGNGIKIPTMLEQSSERTIRNHPSETKLSHGTMPTGRITLLAWIQRYAAHELGVLVKCRLENPNVSDRAKWLNHIEDRSDFEKFIAIIAYIFAFDLTIKDGTEVVRLIGAAKQCLKPILSASGHPDLARALSLLPHLTTDQTLRQEIIVSSGVTSALIRILEWSIKSQSDNTLLVVDSICHFLQTKEAKLQEAMMTQLTAEPVSNGTSGLVMLSRLLGTNDPSLVLAALRIIVLLAKNKHGDYVHRMLKPKVRKLAKQRKGFIGSMAVSAFEVLREQSTDEYKHDLRFSNILAYLGGSLMLDVEGNTDYSLVDCGDRPPLAIDDSQIDGRIIQKIILATRSYYTGRRTAATLTFLKLCRYPGVRRHLLNQQALDNFIRQLRRKETSLLAAYALMTCLRHGLWGSSDLSVDGTLATIVEPIVRMLRKGWFDDAVGLVEGFEIFRHLMKHDKLKRAIENGIYDTLKKKLVYERDGIRTSLLCIDILEDSGVSASLAESDDSNLSTYATSHSSEPPSIVTRLLNDSLECLKNQPWMNQRKCIKILSALSQTAAGEEAIRSHIDEVLGMLLPEFHWKDENPTVPRDNFAPNPRPVPPSRMLGPSYALYLLARNESLRDRIRQSKRYSTLKSRYLSGSLVNGPDTPPWQVKTPNKSDVLVMIARMIKVVDEGFSYDGIGPIPEPPPEVVRHISNLGVLLRDSAVRALQVLPDLAIGFVHGTTTVISRGADRFRRGTVTYAHHIQGVPRSHSRTLELDMVVPSRQNEDTPVFSTQHHVQPAPNVLWSSVAQPPHLNNEQEFVAVPRYHSQETMLPDEVTRFTTPSPPVIRRELYDTRPRSPGNSHDQIIEVPRESRSVVMPARPDPAEIGPSFYEGRQVHAVHTSDLPFIPSEYLARPPVYQSYTR